VPESGHRQPLAISLETPPGLDARTLASAVLQFMQDQYGATVETKHEADGQAGFYVVHVDPARISAHPPADDIEP